MRTKECKVKYVDELDTDFEVKCIEIKANKYRIYGKPIDSNYKLLAVKDNKQKAIDYANNLNPEVYESRLVIEHNVETDADFPIDLER